MNPVDTTRPIVFFDGVCNLCNRSVQFVIRHDKKRQFLFAALQSGEGRAALKEFPGKVPDSFVLYYLGRYYVKSSAALMLCRLLGGWWSLWYAAIILPKFLRDAAYDFIAKRRYKWFGKRSECMVPTPELKARFFNFNA